MREKTLGCNHVCPMCRRKCDEDHNQGAGDRIHMCEGGHQIQGFGGSRHKVNSYAVTYGCHELEDDDMVFW